MKPAPIKPLVAIEDLERLDVRVGTIDTVEEIAGSRSLVRLTVDFGDRRRIVLAGLKDERERPAEITGRQALFVVNVEPKRLMGEISEAMLFDLGYADGITPVLAVPEREVPNGTRAG